MNFHQLLILILMEGRKLLLDYLIMMQHGKTKGKLGFSQTSLKRAINSLTENCYVNVRTVKMKQGTGIPMFFRKNLILYS